MPLMNATEELQRGLVHHRAGKFGEARRCYERVFAEQPDHAKALELAGLASLSMQQSSVGIAFLERSVAASANGAETWFHLATAYFAAQRWEQALAAAQRACELKPSLVEGWCAIGMAAEKRALWHEAGDAYLRAIALRANFPEAHCNLGGVRLKQHDWIGAEQSFRRALTLKPAFPEALNGLGVACKQLGDFGAAQTHFQQALALRPAYSETLYNLANLFQAQEKWSDAISLYRKVVALNPQSSDARHNLACALIAERAFDEAIAQLQQVIAVHPEHADAYNHLGSALLGLHHFDDAIRAHEKAIELRPGFVDALCNLANAYLARNEPSAALRSLRHAAECAPDSVSVAFNTSIALLVSGEWREGFEKYERRWDTEQKAFRKPRAETLWLGREDLSGKTILLWSEQGIGDTVQFARYVTTLCARGARVTLHVQPAVKTLLAAALCGKVTVYSKSESLPAGDFDFQCPLGSLPHALDLTVESLTEQQPYLFVEPSRQAEWAARLNARASAWAQLSVGTSASAARIGIVCSGNARHKNDHQRSLPLGAFAEISAAIAAPLHVLQKDFRSADAETLLSRKDAFVNWSDALVDFTETCGLVSALDLVITVDTSVAHLAGAMGKPTWILLPYAPDWRWLLNRSDTPWYPSVRLFRQPKPGDWASVISEVIAALPSKLSAASA